MTTMQAAACDRVMVAHGGGGQLMQRLIREHIAAPLQARRGPSETGRRNHQALGDPHQNGDACSVARGVFTDSAVLPWSAPNVVFTTDSYVVTPIEFPGGDIGRLAVCGTVNDLAVMGAVPVAISLGLILDEGLPLAVLDRVMASIARAADQADVEIVTGDTKVVERRGGEAGLLINTAGVGRLRSGVALGAARIRPGDCVLINGVIADHGLAVMSVRNGLEFETVLRSDAAPLNELVAALLDSGVDVRFMRDATRGGVAGVLADISEETRLSVEIDEALVPISTGARHAAELLGLDPLTVANEGKVICVVARGDCDRALTVLRAHPLGWHAACMGMLTEGQPPLVEVLTRYGGRRILQRPYGEELPRIC